MHLPAQGAGKIKAGDAVIVKLDNYPFQEYGSIKGKVERISLTSNPLKQNNQNQIDAYLVDISLPNGLRTNYGKQLGFKYEIKGIGDIVSNQRNLLERFFDNLKYASNKN
jgi:archaellum component FlaC